LFESKNGFYCLKKKRTTKKMKKSLIAFVFSMIIASISSFKYHWARTGAPVASRLQNIKGRLTICNCAPTETVGEKPVTTMKVKLSSDMKSAMKAKEKERLSAIRSIQTAIKQKEVDERIEVELVH
jgi:hypothetical protein